MVRTLMELRCDVITGPGKSVDRMVSKPRVHSREDELSLSVCAWNPSMSTQGDPINRIRSTYRHQAC